MVDVASRADGSYRRLLAEPVLRRIAVADICARVPQGMTSITLLLVAAQHAQMAVAALALAGYTLGAAVTAPVRGRLADRRGLFAVTAVCGIGYAAALLGLLACSLTSSPAGLLVASAAVAGLLLPPLSPGVRSLWSAHAQAALRRAAFALDAALFDLSAITGPVVASALATGIAPAAALGVVLVLTGTGVAAIGVRTGPAPLAPARMPARPADAGLGDRRSRSLLGPLRSGALRRLLVTAALTNAALSATEVALIAYARDHHALWASGPLLAGLSAGSITGSLLLGARREKGSVGAGGRPPGTPREPGGPALKTRPGRRVPGRLPRLLACYALGLCGLAAASAYAPLLAVAAPAAGLCLGPALATLFSAAAAAAPAGGGTETQAWLNSIMNGGAAAGAAVAGFAAGRPILGLGLAAATAAAAAVSAARSGEPEEP